MYEPAPIKTDEAGVSEIISMRHVADLPLNGRDPLRLALSVPGVLLGQKATNGVPPGQAFIGAGTREIQNSIAIDGVSIVNNLITITPTRPTVDSIQEVEVQTGTYSAQYGAYMGVHLNLITKSGTNALHGNLSSSSATTGSMPGRSSCRPQRRSRPCARISSDSSWMALLYFPESTTGATGLSSWRRMKACGRSASRRASRR
jgi:outer membrane cobalamin receptor